MLTINKIESNLKTFYHMQFSALQLINPFFIRDDRIITWRNRVPNPGIDDYEAMYGWVISEQQYSLALSDVGVFQIYYEFNSRELIDAALAFLPNPSISHQYIRIDYDPGATGICVNHPICHMHFGYPSDQMRLSVKDLPYPSEFIKFISILIDKNTATPFEQSQYHNFDQIVELNHHLQFNFENPGHSSFTAAAKQAKRKTTRKK